MSDGPFVVLTVCTGNIHRSPAAQYLLAHGLRHDPDIVVTSAGAMPRLGEPVGEEMVALLREEGIETTDFRSRFLTERDVRGADLILGLTREHRGHATTLWPGALRRAYTLKEFARLVEQVPASAIAAVTDSPAAAERLRALTTLASRHRAPVSATADDVVDPHRQGEQAARLAFGEIVEAVETIVRVTRGSRGRHRA